MERVEAGEQFPAGVVAEDADVCKVWGHLGLIIYGRRLVRDLSFLICSFARIQLYYINEFDYGAGRSREPVYIFKFAPSNDETRNATQCVLL